MNVTYSFVYQENTIDSAIHTPTHTQIFINIWNRSKNALHKVIVYRILFVFKLKISTESIYNDTKCLLVIQLSRSVLVCIVVIIVFAGAATAPVWMLVSIDFGDKNKWLQRTTAQRLHTIESRLLTFVFITKNGANFGMGKNRDKFVFWEKKNYLTSQAETQNFARTLCHAKRRMAKKSRQLN